jgi:hypothetical protein
MKISSERTHDILIKATVCSEWDSCNVALVQGVTQETLERWKGYGKVASDLKTNSSYNDFIYLAIDEDCVFLMEREDVVDKISESKAWSYVEDVTEEDLVQEPEQKVAYGIMKFFGNGDICFVAYGKHTGEEFFTERINLYNLL